MKAQIMFTKKNQDEYRLLYKEVKLGENKVTLRVHKNIFQFNFVMN